MTRYTNVGLKRTYVQAGFNYRDEDDRADHATTSTVDTQTPSNDLEVNNQTKNSEEPAKKKRKRGKPKKKGQKDKATEESGVDGDGAGNNNGRSGEALIHGAANGELTVATEGEKKESNDSVSKKAKRKAKAKVKSKSQEARKFASERRRLERQEERYADTTCFACREKGHPAKDCPKALTSIEGSASGGKKLGKHAVGICYRCGSKKHTLSKCKAPVDPENPLPFSSCFVCSEKGHLASLCPQNKSRGIYPDGGSCKLCGETTHFAKDCALRKDEASAKSLFIGTGKEAGADEDDFHILKRKTAVVIQDEKADERRKKKAVVRVAAYSGVVKAFGQTVTKPKKVVSF